MTGSPDSMSVDNAYSGLPAIELAEIDEALQSLSHRRQIVQAAEHEGIDRRPAWIKMAVTAHETGTNRAGPTKDMPPGLGPIVLQRRKFPKSAKALDSSVVRISGDQGRCHRPRGARKPMQSNLSLAERLIGAGMISREARTPAKRHCNRT
jgi:hypothetical protein